MVYSKESSKWKAYQFSDPFAAGAFYVCNKINKTYCRPDCDAKPITNLKSEIKFMDTPSDAITYGYTACTHCDPLNLPVIDVNLLIRCVTTINKQIGFLSPLLDDNEEKNNERIKENIIELKRNEQIQRRSSVPVINYDGKATKDYESTSISKNDSDHYRLVDLACRHLALAAAVNTYQSRLPKLPSSPEDASSPGKKRRRRGGVLGFKELAAKSKLSAWHFHRVFKSVTGLTPKTYGDKCAEYIKSVNINSFTPPAKKATHPLDEVSSIYQTSTSNVNDSDSHPTSPDSSYSNTYNTPYKRMKIETIPEQYTIDNSLSLPQHNSHPQLSSMNTTSQIIPQEQVPTLDSFNMNLSMPQQYPIDPLQNYFNEPKQEFVAPHSQPITDLSISTSAPESKTNFNYNSLDSFNLNNYTFPTAIQEGDIDNFTNFNFENEFGTAQFMNTGYLDEPPFAFEDAQAELAAEIFPHNL